MRDVETMVSIHSFTQAMPNHPKEKDGASTKSDEPFFLIDRKPDTLEIVVRGACGFVAGFFVGAYIAVRIRSLSGLVVAILLVVTPIVVAYLSIRHGDRFWARLFGISNL